LDIHAGEDSLGFDKKDVASWARFLAVVKFLRAGWGTYQKVPQNPDDNFMRVDVKLSYEPERSVQLYFQKMNLYLVGWTIDNDLGKYIGVGPDSADHPQAVTRINAKQVINIRYGDAVGDMQLSQLEMAKALKVLYEHLQLKKDGPADKPPTLQKNFDVIARMTSEMARFEGYCDSFQPCWVLGWSQSEPVTVGALKLGSFNDVVIKWDKFSRKASDDPKQNQDTLRWPGSPSREVSPEEARAAIGIDNRVRSRSNT
jgi:hypothetical protein